ncbi:hypothetical protein [Aridibaculum aurantiacum]|uniref:hypothetical protein n=1 Tax=Aridibaculum aurantiacum TaxID=2810307 RepID=UPI001A97644A|nr:hypothetical protein [Aridibaculum aurantiacum]
MSLTLEHRKKIVLLYCGIFYLLAILKWWNGLFLYQAQPHLFNNRYDVFTWIFMKTGIHQWLLDNPACWKFFDVVFYAMPALFFLLNSWKISAGRLAAVAMLIINWIYIQCFTLYPTNSIESYTAWLLFPLLFMMASVQSFYYVFHGLRYFFLYFFASAGVWKITQMAIFNGEQMSGVLLFQHAEYLVSSPGYWYTNFIYWLARNPSISYCLYLAGLLLELCFFIGFFTRRYDRLLIVLFIVFLLADILLMRIHYWEVAPFLITLWYSKLKLAEK